MSTIRRIWNGGEALILKSSLTSTSITKFSFFFFENWFCSLRKFSLFSIGESVSTANNGTCQCCQMSVEICVLFSRSHWTLQHPSLPWVCIVLRISLSLPNQISIIAFHKAAGTVQACHVNGMNTIFSGFWRINLLNAQNMFIRIVRRSNNGATDRHGANGALFWCECCGCSFAFWHLFHAIVVKEVYNLL